MGVGVAYMKYVKAYIIKMNLLIKKVVKRIQIIKFINKYIEDFLIVSGLAVIVITTFLLSKIAGLYSLGGILLGLGIYFAKNPPRKG